MHSSIRPFSVQVLGSDSDSFDGPTFDPIAFINSKFSTEESLSGLEDMIKSYKGEITRYVLSVLTTLMCSNVYFTVFDVPHCSYFCPYAGWMRIFYRRCAISLRLVHEQHKILKRPSMLSVTCMQRLLKFARRQMPVKNL